MYKKFARSVTPRAAGVLVLLVASAVAAAVAVSFGGGSSAPVHRLSAPAGATSASGGKSTAGKQVAGSGPIIRQALHQDVSPPLRTLKSLAGPLGPRAPRDEGDEDKGVPQAGATSHTDPVVQTRLGAGQIPSTSVSFAGLSAGQAGYQYVPPDPNGAVGPNNYFEIANSEIAIYTKTGSKVYGPATTNTLWSGFGGGCQSNDDGDGTVVYDQFSGRWIVQQFSISTSPFLECVAVSTSSDPTGSYYRYSFSYGSDFPDYPKLGVWPDGYYVTYNIFGNGGSSYTGPEVCALDRTKMIANTPGVTQQCFKLSSAYFSLLPSSVDGTSAPPAGSPDYLLSYNYNTLNSLLLWKFHVDWSNPANTKLTGPLQLGVAAFNQACGGGTCIAQPGTTAKLDSLGDRLMYRLAYRNFGDHESLVVAQSVNANGVTGMRWYEIRNPNGSPTVYQQGTYAPDGTYRWMGSVAQDHVGDMALGFAVSSSSVYPGARYTGRLAGDPLGSMTQGEGVLVNGIGSQVGSYTRWGDYTSLAVDPSDDCIFWYLAEYQPSGQGEFNWRTQIGAFKFPSCSGSGGSPPTVTSFSPTSGAVGTQVDVQGTNFTGATGLTFNGTADTSFQVNSSTDITAHVPAGATTGPISVTTPNGSGTSTSTFSVTGGGGGSPPVVSSFSPGTGPVGTSVSITGSGFTGATNVTFNGTAANFTFNSDTSISATVPNGATTGPISVTTPNGTGTSSTSFTVATPPQKPTITGFSPTAGRRGSQVVITGTNFTGATSVKLGILAASYTVNSDTKITAIVPSTSHVGSMYRWSVTTPGGTASSAGYYWVFG